MTMSFPMEIIVTPKVTYIYADWESQVRRVYTDGRTWPEYILPEFNGYSIGAVARRERRRRLRHAVDRNTRHERPALVRLGGRRAAREQRNGRARRDSAHRREHDRGSHHDDRRRADGPVDREPPLSPRDRTIPSGSSTSAPKAIATSSSATSGTSSTTRPARSTRRASASRASSPKASSDTTRLATRVCAKPVGLAIEPAGSCWVCTTKARRACTGAGLWRCFP